MKTYESFHDAYRGTLADLLESGQVVSGVQSSRSIGSGFTGVARPFTELQATGFRLLNPRCRWLIGSPRRPNAAFAAANMLFTLAGGHELEMITAYNSRGQQFAEDQSRFESAFGSRLFSPGHQLAYVRKKLTDDRSSRRALAVIYAPEDTLLDRLDTPCAIALQFLIRDDRLDCICFMRSQSAAMVLPYDVFLFTMIHEWVAHTLSVELGSYAHVSGSLHFYDDERSMVESIVNGDGGSPAMPSMTSAGPAIASQLIAAERHLREGGDIINEKLDIYWRGFLRPIADRRKSVADEPYFVDA